jgi:hypothetical protein
MAFIHCLINHLSFQLFQNNATFRHETLETLKELVGPEQRDKVIAMQNRLALVIVEIDEDPSVAQSDLEVLANNLTILENTFFAKP